MSPFPTMEVVLACEDLPPHTNGTKFRKQAGDIIAVRDPLGYIGTKESSAYVWLLMTGLSLDEWWQMTASMVGAKRRYAVPFARLAQVASYFDERRARDVTDRYQPFHTLNEQTHHWVDSRPPLQAHGLIFDKRTGRYI